MDGGIVGYPSTPFRFDKYSNYSKTVMAIEYRDDKDIPVDLEFGYGYVFNKTDFDKIVDMCYVINSVVFARIILTEEDIINISLTLLKKCNKVKKLKFNCMNTITILGLRYLVDAIKQMKDLQELYLMGCGLNDAGAVFILDSIADNKTLHTLNMDNNNFGDKTSFKLADILKDNKNLMDVSMDELLVTNKTINALYTSLIENRTLMYLNIGFYHKTYTVIQIMRRIYMLLKGNIKLRDKQILADLTPAEKKEYDLFIRKN